MPAKKIYLTIKSKIVLTSCIALVLISILAFLSYQSIRSLAETAEWADHTHLVLGNASTIEKLIMDVETGERGFLIAGKNEFLEPYEFGKERLYTLLTETKELVSDNPDQVERLGEIDKLILLWQKKAGIPEIQKRREVVQSATAVSEFKNLQTRTVGKEIFDNIRYEFQTIRTEFELQHNLMGIVIATDTLQSLVDMETG